MAGVDGKEVGQGFKEGLFGETVFATAGGTGKFYIFGGGENIEAFFESHRLVLVFGFFAVFGIVVSLRYWAHWDRDGDIVLFVGTISDPLAGKVLQPLLYNEAEGLYSVLKRSRVLRTGDELKQIEEKFEGILSTHSGEFLMAATY